MIKQKKTLLFYGEGLVGERVFLGQVKALCLKQHHGFDPKLLSVSVDSDNGGGFANILREAQNELDSGSFSRCLLLLDTDVSWPRILTTKYKGTEMLYMGCSPCLEGYLLRLQGKPVPRSSPDCKRAFYGKTNPRGIEVKEKMRDVVTWQLLQNSYNNSSVMRCILDHYDSNKHTYYQAGLRLQG